MMGAGKSTVAGALASRLDVRAADTDAEIERHVGMTIAELIDAQGEPAFRRIEAEVVERCVADASIGVVALGGGAFMTPRVRETCASTTVIYLHASADELYRRLERVDVSARPLLRGALGPRLRQLYNARDATYRTADHVVETEGRSVGDIVDVVAALPRLGVSP